MIDNTSIREFHYRIAWHASSPYPGAHAGSFSGEGYEFQRHQTLIDNPNPRHLDIHASAQNPFGDFLVRSFKQRGRIPVQVIADLSASMAFKSKHSKSRTMIEFIQSAAWSAARGGDLFALHACSDTIHWDYHIPLKWYKSPPYDQLQELAQASLQGTAEALLDINAYLGSRPSLVFLVSDFHFKPQQLTAILENLVNHDVVPVVIWDDFEQLPVSNGSYFTLQDAETGQVRSLLMRQALRQKLSRVFSEHKKTICHICNQFGRQPFFIEQGFDADAMTDYFYS